MHMERITINYCNVTFFDSKNYFVSKNSIFSIEKCVYGANYFYSLFAYVAQRKGERIK